MNTEVKEEIQIKKIDKNNKKMNAEVKGNIQEKIRLDKAYINYHDIIDKKLPYKFAYLDEWLLKNSKLLLLESNEYEIQTNKRFKTYKRGTIIKVDFGVGIGSEMSQVHFAIVLSNYDNPKNNVLTVIPLTSKEGKFNLNLGTLVIDKLINKIKIEITKLGINEELEKKETDLENEIKIKKLDTLLSYYKSNAKNTFACPSLITTISKARIFKPINEYDIVGREKCDDTIMDKIDNCIKENITKSLTNEKK